MASMVVFEDGLPRKSDYRRFSIRSSRSGRRGQRGRSGPAPFHPVSGRTRRGHRHRVRTGGWGQRRTQVVPLSTPTAAHRWREAQVNAAAAELRELGIDDIAVAGLANASRRCRTPGSEDPLILSRAVGACICCRGSVTRPTASPSPTTGRSAAGGCRPVRGGHPGCRPVAPQGPHAHIRIPGAPAQGPSVEGWPPFRVSPMIWRQ